MQAKSWRFRRKDKSVYINACAYAYWGMGDTIWCPSPKSLLKQIIREQIATEPTAPGRDTDKLPTASAHLTQTAKACWINSNVFMCICMYASV